MLKDITIGQYYPEKSFVHKLDSRIKIILSITYIIMLFCAENFVALGICAIFVISEYLFSKVPLKMILKSLKPIIPILIITVILNLFFIKGETYILEFYFIKISVEGILFALKLVIRIILLIILSAISIWYVYRYASKVEEDPKNSLLYDQREEDLERFKINMDDI
ncbi:MAG: CbiQ family ECF transporter T component, partial [Oscillospiraceae bacterium]